MTSYRLDTNVISELAPGRPTRDVHVVNWLEANSSALFLSVVTVAEIEAGIALAIRGGASGKAGRLAEWLAAVLHLYGSRILACDVPTARVAGTIFGKARSEGLSPGWPDIMIAATAAHHELTVLTRKLRHFQSLGVAVADPFVAGRED